MERDQLGKIKSITHFHIILFNYLFCMFCLLFPGFNKRSLNPPLIPTSHTHLRLKGKAWHGSSVSWRCCKVLFIFPFFMCVCVLTTCTHSSPVLVGVIKKVSVPLKLELKMVLSHDLCAENWTWALCKSNQSSWLLSHLSRSTLLIFSEYMDDVDL